MLFSLTVGPTKHDTMVACRVFALASTHVARLMQARPPSPVDGSSDLTERPRAPPRLRPSRHPIVPVVWGR